ncbi:unnamed protein product [Brassica oleracea]
MRLFLDRQREQNDGGCESSCFSAHWWKGRQFPDLFPTFLEAQEVDGVNICCKGG